MPKLSKSWFKRQRIPSRHPLLLEDKVDQIEKELDNLLAEVCQTIAQASDLASLEEIRVKRIGRSGTLNNYFSQLKQANPKERGRLGQKLNSLKQQIEDALEHKRKALSQQKTSTPAEDMTLPGYLPAVGHFHPITQTIIEIVNIFRTLGFFAVDGPEIETDYYNFQALNIPEEHPSRESFDTFYVKSPPGDFRYLLRSHTSPVQIRFMEKHPPPFQIIVPGRVFRPDAVDASHSFQFHQVEGLAVGKGITFGDLKGTLTAWARGMFGPNAQLRFRPHYFPFTEPSAEGDLSCIFCQGGGCRVCGHKGWLEILGCGMVHPAVFKAAKYPAGTIGFAFGMGVERIAMLKFEIEDIRLFYENDVRFLQQFP